MIQVKHILVPTDFDQTSSLALDYARELASLFKAKLSVAHVVNDVFALRGGTEGSVGAFPQLQRELEDEARSQIDALLTDTERKAAMTTVVLVASSPAQALVDYARTSQIDLIVMGTHGRGGAPAAVIGSVAERVVRTAPCPVLTVRRPAGRDRAG